MNKYWLRKYHWRYHIARYMEKLTIKLVYKLPRCIVYWSAIRLICYATKGKYENQVVPELTAMDALKRWSD